MKIWNGYQKGINLGGWFSQCDYSKDRFDNFIKEEDLAKIAGWGLDHVRVPVDYNLVENDDGSYKESGFAYLDRVIDWCGNNKLNMILDLHKTYGYSFDVGEQESGFFFEEKHQERFYRLWEEFARRYGKFSNRLAFELLNEVTDKSYCEKWREISAKCIDRIRAIAPDTYILLGGYWNNHASAVKDLQLPVDDKIIYNFHCYDPLIITHQGARWVQGMPADFRYDYDHTYNEYYDTYQKYFANTWGGFLPNVPDMNAKFGSEFFINLMAEAAQVAEERNVPLYCGEYGVIELATPETILSWYKDINTAFKKYGIGRAAWSYRGMDFDICGSHLDSVIEELVKVM